MPCHRATLPLFGITIFLGAALMFLLQLILGRMVLPLLGGSPAVWNTAMVFYQAVLLAGYAYAHWLGARPSARVQRLVHGGVLVAAMAALPLGLPGGWRPPAEGSPVFWLLGLLAVAAGLPFFAISATGPLLQRWFSTTGHKDAGDPYFLYAAGNAGNLLGLLGYPLLIEPHSTLKAQAGAWSVAFGLLALLSLACSVFLRASRQGSRGPEERISRRRRLLWVACAMVPSSLMLSVTTYVSSEIAAVPLLWVLPLALYLATFVLVFSRWGAGWGRAARRFLPLPLVALAMLAGTGATTPMVLLAGLHLAGFFIAALACHGRMAADRPGPEHLTAFYLCLSLGGVLGGAFNALLAPLIFEGWHEYPLMLVAAAWLGTAGAASRGSVRALLPGLAPGALAFLLLSLLPGKPGPAWNAVVLGIPALLCFLLSRHAGRFAVALAGFFLAAGQAPERGLRTLARERGFHGIHRVASDGKFHYLFHGKTVHGMQAVDPALRKIPLSYYHPAGPLGRIFAARGFGSVAAVGLGAGAAAMYGEPGQAFIFHEIDPEVERIARDPRYFSYLAASPARVEVVIGDARLTLQESDTRCDLLILDAYGSDSVPVHLLTREALALYRERLAPGGWIAFHISNLHLDLRPVVAGLAADAGMACVSMEDADFPEEEAAAGRAPSRWAVVAARREDLAPLLQTGDWEEPGEPGRVWTDDHSSILPLLDLRGE